MTLLDQLEAALAAATHLPWRTCENRLDAVRGERTIDYVLGAPQTFDYGSGPEDDSERIITTDGGHYGPKPADADLIVAAVNALPQLLRLARAAEAWRDQTRTPNTLSGQRRRERNQADGVALSALHKAIDALKEGR